MDLLEPIGQQLGNYRLIRLLGQGGFANVYLAEHLYLGTQAAIKILQTQLTGSDIENFRSEARTIALLEHPHIVQILDFGVEGKIPYFVMDNAPNGTLRQRYPKGTRLQMASIIQYVVQVAEALQYAHSRKLIHRDIKPENMLIGSNEEILLSDFGIAVLAQSSHDQAIQKAVGTISYMAPEQIQGKPQFASDQYALGIVVYEWLCGERPFRGSFTEIASQHIFTPPPPLREKVPQLSPGVEEVVLRALAKDPQQRFASVQAFADALEQANLSESSVLSHSRGILATQSPPSKPFDTSGQHLSSTLVDSSLPHVQSKHYVSRRAIVTGIAALTGLSIAGGSVLWLVRSRASFGSTVTPTPIPTPTAAPTSSPTPTVTPTPPPLGTLRLTHAHSSTVYSVAWSPDGKYIASGDTQTVQIWDATTGNTLLTHSDGGYKLGWSPDGKYIASTDGGQTVQVWDTVTGNTILTYRGHSAGVWDVAWSPDGTHIASASDDKTAQIWDAMTGSVHLTYHGHPRSVRTVAWSPDGKFIASGGDYIDTTVRVWNANTGNTITIDSGYTLPVRALAWSPNSKYVAVANQDGTVRGLDVSTSHYIFVYTIDARLGGVGAVAWSPDGKWIAAGRDDRTVHIFDAVTGISKFIYHGYTSGVSWSPDSTQIASGGDLAVQVWQAM